MTDASDVGNHYAGDGRGGDSAFGLGEWPAFPSASDSLRAKPKRFKEPRGTRADSLGEEDDTIVMQPSGKPIGKKEVVTAPRSAPANKKSKAASGAFRNEVNAIAAAPTTDGADEAGEGSNAPMDSPKLSKKPGKPKKKQPKKPINQISDLAVPVEAVDTVLAGSSTASNPGKKRKKLRQEAAPKNVAPLLPLNTDEGAMTRAKKDAATGTTSATVPAKLKQANFLHNLNAKIESQDPHWRENPRKPQRINTSKTTAIAISQTKATAKSHRIDPRSTGYMNIAMASSLPAKSQAVQSVVIEPYFTKQIESTPGYKEQFASLIASIQQLENNGYNMAKFSPKDLDSKKRCQRCAKVLKSGKVRPANLAGQFDKPEKDVESIPEPSRKVDTSNEDKTDIQQPKKAPENFKCKFHPGMLQGKRWSCCGVSGGGYFTPIKPCSGSNEHFAREYPIGYLESLYQLHETPPSNSSAAPSLFAAAIDCEMGTAASGDSELIRVTIVDYLSGRVALDKLVYPDVQMAHLNTKYSGVTWPQLNAAKRNGQALMGVQQAREAVWDLVKEDTILVAHSGGNDLRSLKWIHRRIVDTYILEPEPPSEIEARIRAKEAKKEKERKKAEAKAKEEEQGGEKAGAAAEANSEGRLDVDDDFDPETLTVDDLFPGLAKPGQAPLLSTTIGPLTDSTATAAKSETTPQQTSEEVKKEAAAAKKAPKPRVPGKRSLKHLAKVKLGREIQVGKDGHDSVEDALAARDLADWTARNGSVSVEEVLADQEGRGDEFRERYAEILGRGDGKGKKEKKKKGKGKDKKKDEGVEWEGTFVDSGDGDKGKIDEGAG